MSQRPFIVKAKRGGKPRYAQTSRLHTKYSEITRPTGRVINGLGQVVEGTGRYDQRTLTIAPQTKLGPEGNSYGDGAVRPTWDSGLGASNVYVHPANTASGVKGAVRRIRPQDSVAIDIVDRDIRELEAQIAGLRLRRRELVAEAWKKGHVVYLNEVQPLKGEHTRIVEGDWV